MQYPVLTPESSSRDFIEVFGGYNHNLRIGENEFYDMQNMSSSGYPLLTTRSERGEIPEKHRPVRGSYPLGILFQSDFYSAEAFGSHIYVCKNGQMFWHFINEIDPPSTDNPDKQRRRLILMGAYLIILPDKKYINIEKYDAEAQDPYPDKGSIEAEFSTASDTTIRACLSDGTPITFNYIGEEPPKEPMDGSIWLDISDTKPVYKKYFAAQSSWQSVVSEYMLVSGTDIDSTAFKEGDGVKLSGFTDEQLTDLNGVSIVKKVTVNGLVMTAAIDLNMIDKEPPEVVEFPIKPGSVVLVPQTNTSSAILYCSTAYEKDDLRGFSFTNSLIKDKRLICTSSDAAEQNSDAATSAEYPYTVKLDFSGLVSISKKENSLYSTQNYGELNVVTVTDPLTFSRKMPEMDYVIESKNRLWGCRYGLNADGETVNEIYASKLGDFKNWQCFEGLSTDSYAASCGTDGVWTGAVNYLGSPVFFKENYIHTVFGSYPSQYQINSVVARGVKNGSSGSLAIVNETLFYLSNHGVCAYNGSLPTEISAAFGEERYHAGVACAFNGKYFISMFDASEHAVLMVYDTARGMWHKEDDLIVKQMCAADDDVYYINAESRAFSLFGTGGKDTTPIKWYVESGIFGLSRIDRKYISRMNLRLALDIGATVSVLIQYDSSDIWETLCFIEGNNLKPFTLPIKPRRCDHFRLRLEGIGGVKIYSISKTMIQGSDL